MKTSLKCRPELLRQWAPDVARNPSGFAAVLALSPEYVAMLVHDAAAAADLEKRFARVPAVVTQAFEIADTAMFEILETEGVPGDEHRTVLGFTHEGGVEVNSLAEASAAMQQAFEWLRSRGYVELGADGTGEFIQVVRRPEDDDGFVGVPASLWDDKSCDSCKYKTTPVHQEPCFHCTEGHAPGGGHADLFEPADR